MSKEKVYRDYDKVGLDAQYNNQLAAPLFRNHLKRYREMTELAKDTLTCIENVKYGTGEKEQLDIYMPLCKGAPVQVFIHGGAWQQLDKNDSGLAAPAFVEAGAMFVSIGFGRVPDVTIDTMVDQVRRAVAWLSRNIGNYGGNSDRIFISGHSSGAHLVSQCLSADWAGQFECPADVIKGATFISGLGDLEPVRLSYRNALLNLDEVAVQRLSLIYQYPTVKCPLLTAYASGDTAEFQRQTREVGAYWRDHKRHTEVVEVAGCGHYDILLELADPQSILFRSTLALMNLK